MTYLLLIKRQAKKTLQQLSRSDRNRITEKIMTLARIKKIKSKNDYVRFNPAEYVDNPIALARIKAGMTQVELAKRMNVTQAYISKIEQDKVTAKMLKKVKDALDA